jgi:hypothetical protein
MNTVRPRTFSLLSWAAIVAFLSAFTASAAAQNYIFNRADYATGGAPQSLAIGDFNRDGRVDVVVCNTANATVGVLLGNVDGTFQAQGEYPVAGYPTGVAVGDFNKDGKLDLVVSSQGGFAGVSILLGNGDGTFQPYVFYSAGVYPDALAVGDFNKDGNLDVAVASEDSFVYILSGDGKGGFGTPASYPTGGSPRSIVAGDFNNDGYLDLATANYAGSSVSVLLNNGNGTFKANQDYNTGSGCISVAAGDLRHIGRLDLVAGAQGVGQVWVLLSNGDGTFQKGVPYAAGEGFAAIVALGDFNGDGKLDVAVTSDTAAGFVSVLPGKGDGTLQASIAFGTGSYPLGIAVADFNTDGKVDLATVNDSTPGSISVLLSNGPSFFGGHTDYGLGSGPSAIINVDVNGDGTPDLVLVDNSDDLMFVLTGKGDGTFNPPVNYAAPSHPAAIASGDFNRDHHLDLVTANEGGSVSVFLNNGDGTFGAASEFATAGQSAGVAVGDFNKDGFLDIVATDMINNQMSVLLGNGDGTFKTHVDYTTGLFPVGVTVGDFNNDGWPDIAVADEGGTVSIFINKADHSGTFLPKVDYSTGGGSPISIATASFRGNKILDLAVATDTFSPGVAVLLGNGNGSFQNPVFYTTDNNAYAVTTGDFNNDGKVDLAVAVTNNGNYPGLITVMLGQGDGTFPTELSYATGQTPYSITAADFNRDGALDLATANAAPADAASVMLNHAVMAALPPFLSFGSLKVGSTSNPKTMTVSNPGVTPLHFTGISITGDFAQSNNCPGILIMGTNCTVTVTFTPTQEGKRTGSVIGKDNAGSSPQSGSLSGTGLAPVVSLSPTSLTFNTQLLNIASPPQMVTLTNTGNQVLNIVSIVPSGDFAQTNNCGASVQVGASCTITVTFTPTAPGTRNGAVTITDNAPNTPQSVPLTGTGTEVQLSPPSLAFGNQPVNTSSLPQTVTLTNVGSSLLSISAITFTGANPADFTETDNCGSSVGPGGQCSINVTFTPTQTGARSANLSITDNGGASPQLVPLSGTGT